MSRPQTHALGVRVKSGWATAVLVAGPAQAPRVVDRRTIALSDPAVAASRQPYNAVMGARASDAPKLEAMLRSVVARVTRGSVGALLAEYQAAGHVVRRVALVVGSLIDPARIGNDHIRAHALEGQLFRSALEGAVRSRRLPCSVVVERAVYATAAGTLKRSERELKRAVTELGRSLPGPWRADEKTATVAAWMTLRGRA
ncbi:MAG TPA: hypothetical protein VH137_10580 [Gemmatimonadales bacterium]|nr:hypothetical protein [Gemmatimonadales bacterium]